MTLKHSILSLLSLTLIFASCNAQESNNDQVETAPIEQEVQTPNKEEPHRYGGWYCPDNFGFVPVDVQQLDQVPAIADRLPTEEELHNNMSLISVDTEKYPDARALKMKLPRVATVYSEHKGISELVIVIQAIVVQSDTVVGYRFVNGGNGSAWMSDVSFLSDEEVADMGAQPFFYSKSVLKASTKDIWKAASKTDRFKSLGKKFDEQKFFTSAWNPDSEAHLRLNSKGEKATGYVGMVYGNYYLHIDYDRNGVHYSEKILFMENHDDNTTEFFVASGPYPNGYDNQKSILESWVAEIKAASESH